MWKHNQIKQTEWSEKKYKNIWHKWAGLRKLHPGCRLQLLLNYLLMLSRNSFFRICMLYSLEKFDLKCVFIKRSSNVSSSLKIAKESRFQRLEAAPKHPEPIQIISKGFKRNADAIAEVLLRANGHCEKCGKEAPFKRAKDGTPYLEVHHKIMLSQGGEDTVQNAIATCPNCHRGLHFGA